MSDAENIVQLSPCDFVAPSGVGYGELAPKLDGRPVMLRGMLSDGPFNTLLLTDGAQVMGCSHEAPGATVALVEPSPGLRLLPRSRPVRLLGILEYGPNVDEFGTLTYIRLRSGNPC
jgi:hypothetical protein